MRGRRAREQQLSLFNVDCRHGVKAFVMLLIAEGRGGQMKAIAPRQIFIFFLSRSLSSGIISYFLIETFRLIRGVKICRISQKYDSMSKSAIDTFRREVIRNTYKRYFLTCCFLKIEEADTRDWSEKSRRSKYRANMKSV